MSLNDSPATGSHLDEGDVRTRETRNRKIRLKLTDWCNLQCPFCHSEGAAGANEIDVSDDTLIDSLKRLRQHYDYVHLTGGEPTSYAHLDMAVEMLRGLDYKVAMTSNGLFNTNKVLRFAPHLEYMNISFHTISPAYFQSFVRSASSSAKVIDVVTRNIEALVGVLPIRLNTVISGSNNEQQLESVHEFAEDRSLPLKLVPDWRTNAASKRFGFQYLESKGYALTEIVKIVPGSNVRKIYQHPTRAAVEFKDIEHFRPEFLCAGCQIVDKCVESFSFLRIERSPAKYRLCIYKPELEKHAFFEVFENNLRPLLDVTSW